MEFIPNLIGFQNKPPIPGKMANTGREAKLETFLSQWEWRSFFIPKFLGCSSLPTRGDRSRPHFHGFSKLDLSHILLDSRDKFWLFQEYLGCQSVARNFQVAAGKEPKSCCYTIGSYQRMVKKSGMDFGDCSFWPYLFKILEVEPVLKITGQWWKILVEFHSRLQQIKGKALTSTDSNHRSASTEDSCLALLGISIFSICSTLEDPDGPGDPDNGAREDIWLLDLSA